ncbi:MAG: hypothetical protein WCV72_04270 [Patescibacteria group bacterium]|jgi:hypothetical protein
MKLSDTPSENPETQRIRIENLLRENTEMEKKQILVLGRNGSPYYVKTSQFIIKKAISEGTVKMVEHDGYGALPQAINLPWDVISHNRS